MLGYMIPIIGFGVYLLVVIVIFIKRWNEEVAEAKKFEEKEKALKKEKEERLRFDGKQNRLFYHIVWKNFKRNWKDYSLILVSNTILFAVMVVGFCMKEILNGKYEIENRQLFGGLSEILLNAMIPIIILSVFVIIVLFFYYIKCRARNFGVFLTLGMRRKTLYYFTALEFVSVFVSSLVIGAGIGRATTAMIGNTFGKMIGINGNQMNVGIKPYALSIALVVAIYIVALLVSKEIFGDFNVGKSTDLRAVAEKIPGKSRVLWLVAGVLICSFSVLQYSKLYRFENEYLLLVFFVGVFLIIRYGIAVWLMRERNEKKYLNKLMFHNQLFHKSKTNAGFISVLTITQFCILFYFAFQIGGTLIAEEAEDMFPYDFVCYADESDDELFAELQQKYQVELYEYPMLRVSAYDSTEVRENEMQSQKPIQGQHVGIAESTYHALKKQLNPSYEEKSLGLDPKGSDIYIVYQQDKSIKAQPTAFYSPIKKPLLHIGQPCRSVDAFSFGRKDVGYKFYEVKGEEIGSLTGIFRQGTRENLIVFSDEYFEKMKDLWKTTNLRTGEQILEEENRILDVTITQGVTKLVLINAGENVKEVGEELKAFEQKHLEKETKIYYGFLSAGVYDTSIAYHYGKAEMIQSIHTERAMKLIMNVAAVVLFFLMNLMVLIVKMLSERDLNVKRSEFLECMGMYKKSRMKLIRGEIFKYYILLPFVIASISAVIYTAAVSAARMYTKADILNYMKYYIPVYLIYMIVHLIVSYIVSTVYAHRVEGLKYGRNS